MSEDSLDNTLLLGLRKVTRNVKVRYKHKLREYMSRTGGKQTFGISVRRSFLVELLELEEEVEVFMVMVRCELGLA